MRRRQILNADRAVHRQVAERIKSMIARRYEPGDVLPKYRELTDRFGVSLLTVNKAMRLLAEQGIVSPIRRKGTVVNRSLDRRELNLVRLALVFSCPIARVFHTRYLADICHAVFDRAEELRMDVHLLSLYRNEIGDRPRVIAETGVDGVILLSVSSAELLAALGAMEIPVVSADQPATDHGLDSVVCDEPAATTKVAQHLASRGHRRVVYAEVNSVRWREDGRLRRESFHEAARQQGLSVEDESCRVESSGVANPLVTALARRVRAGGRAPTAIVADTAGTATSLVGQLAQLGVRAPRDVTVAAVAAVAGEMAPQYEGIARCEFDFYELGRQAMRLLEERAAKSSQRSPVVVAVAPSFVDAASRCRRSSVACGP